ncbi:MAG TPA: hypothetical protein VGW12_21370 [Pyrinomonadaceae bacterium]|nr:hypothetical protein [Pyrinomonadaceae bacterium]
MDLEIHKIKEIHPGVFWMLLDWPTSKLLHLLLSDKYQYVWCHNHLVGNYTWDKFTLPLFGGSTTYNVISRTVTFDFILPTGEFRSILPQLRAGIHVVQVDRLPPDYFDLDKVKGKERYRLLNECDWLFEFDVPGNDYGQIASPRKEWLESILHSDKIDLKNLP